MARNKRLTTAKGAVRLDRVAESVLEPVVSRAGFSSTQILSAWPDIVGPDLATRSRPERLRWPTRRDDAEGRNVEGATLMVRAEGIDALEIQHMSANITARINAIFGWRAVARVAIRQGPVSTGAPAQTSPDAPVADRPAGPGSGVEALIEAVDDEALRSALSRLGSRIARDTDTKV